MRWLVKQSSLSAWTLKQRCASKARVVQQMRRFPFLEQVQEDLLQQTDNRSSPSHFCCSFERLWVVQRKSWQQLYPSCRSRTHRCSNLLLVCNLCVKITAICKVHYDAKTLFIHKWFFVSNNVRMPHCFKHVDLILFWDIEFLLHLLHLLVVFGPFWIHQ